MSPTYSQLREGYGQVLRERVAASAPPLRLAPPTPAGHGAHIEHGCQMCGVGTVTAPAGRVARLGGRDAAARHLWRSVMLTHWAGTMSGHVCPACSQAREAAGSWGPSAVEGAYAGHLDATGQDAAMLRARIHDGVAPPLPTFGALVVDAVTAGAAVPAPSSEPWAHLRRVVDRL